MMKVCTSNSIRLSGRRSLLCSTHPEDALLWRSSISCFWWSM